MATVEVIARPLNSVVRLTMESKLTPSGLGQPVRPLIRILAALIGLVCLFGLILHAVLLYFGAPGYRLELKTVADLSLLARQRD